MRGVNSKEQDYRLHFFICSQKSTLKPAPLGKRNPIVCLFDKRKVLNNEYCYELTSFRFLGTCTLTLMMSAVRTSGFVCKDELWTSKGSKGTKGPFNFRSVFEYWNGSL
ncbi:hypothetical protein L596_024689 [Steinernema carpocapsae]|uniref:Uncharacterized protein n=1 Tax=Steinernema carpocapsae TaxID=34508 RepID=A0A4U5M5G7_STECR|nr:hypothetical protein L596_024689 [Steinernema carpocapsae]